MINLSQLYQKRYLLKQYPEKIFVKPKLPIKLIDPYLFIEDKKQALITNTYALSTINDRLFDIYVVSSDKQVLFYLIDTKHSRCRAITNGLILKSKNAKVDRSDQVKLRYNMNSFIVLTNTKETCIIFGRNMTTEPKT